MVVRGMKRLGTDGRGTMASDEQRMGAWVDSRDPLAFEQLVEQHWPTAYRLALHCLGSAEAAGSAAPGSNTNAEGGSNG